MPIKVTWLGDPAEEANHITRDGVNLPKGEAVEVPDNWPLLEAARANTKRFKVESSPDAKPAPEEHNEENAQAQAKPSHGSRK